MLMLLLSFFLFKIGFFSLQKEKHSFLNRTKSKCNEQNFINGSSAAAAAARKAAVAAATADADADAAAAADDDDRMMTEARVT
jgi:hypothetical protein